MLDAWEAGDIETVGAIFREDGIGLRDEYVFSCNTAPSDTLSGVSRDCCRHRQCRSIRINFNCALVAHANVLPDTDT